MDERVMREGHVRKKLVVVGGGTAGWLTALIVRASLEEREWEISVLDSSKIPSIGVGEGTTAIFRQALDFLNLDEREFIQQTGATIKLGIRHQDWRELDHFYDAPLDDPHLLLGGFGKSNPTSLHLVQLSRGKSLADIHLFGWMMKNKRAPFRTDKEGRLTPTSPFHYAYHFDQALVGNWLRSKAENIAHIDDTLVGIEQTSLDGDVRRLVLEEKGTIEIDFVFDCTGFARRVMSNLPNCRWRSYADIVPLNRAMPFWLDHASAADIKPYTTARALGAGWMWEIPTQNRIGCGYVYSDRHTSADNAKKEVENLLGRGIEVRADLNFDPGRLEKAWISNCISIGLSQSFLEPLEATSIHGTLAQLQYLFSLSKDPFALAGRTKRADAYNQVTSQQVDDFVSFINLHYASRRSDTSFWRDFSRNYLTIENRKLIVSLNDSVPNSKIFPRLPGNIAHVGHQLYFPVLSGLGLIDPIQAKEKLASDVHIRKQARHFAKIINKKQRNAASQSLSHRAFLKVIT